MKKIFFLLLIALFSTIGYAQLNKEQQYIKKTFFDFLKFYQKNEKKFNSFHLYKGVGKENNPPYKIQWKEVDRYFAWLRINVPFVGETYIKSEKNDFKYSDSCFKANPEEEIPMGFDYDRWTGSQESVQYMIEWYTSSKNKYEVIITSNKAILRIGGELTEGDQEKDRGWSAVHFVKEKGKWKMAANIYPVEENTKTD